MDDDLYLRARTQHLAAIQLVCLVVSLIAHRRSGNRNHVNLPSRDLLLHRRKVREEMLHNLSTSGKCREIIRMNENAFRILCQKLESDGGLRSTQRTSVEEQVARFLHIVGNDSRTRMVSWLYRRSKSATSRHFHRVLNAIILLEDQYIQQPNGEIVQREIQEKSRFYPYFKDCIGAIDGTHVRVKVNNKDAPRYRGRKGYPTINVLVACTFDLKFTYVLTGWEGTASDSRIIKDAFTREDKLVIPNGKFYLVDGGLPHTSTLMAPFRGVRYHLKEYSARAPQNPRELFNLRHASLRNSIERAFGVLKRRFPIIRSTTEPFYSIETQYDLLFELFAKDRATGSSAITAKEKRKLLESEQREQMIDDVDQMLDTNGVSLENVDNTNDIHVPSSATSSHGQFPCKSKSKRMKKKLEEDDGFATKVMSSIDKVAEAIEKSTKVMESSRPHVYTEGEIYAELMMMGMEAPNIFKAYIFLTTRPEKTRALFGCPVDVRMSMLDAMMEDESK